MIDTGACGNFIDSHIVKTNKIPVFTKCKPVSLTLIDGTTLTSGPITTQSQPLLMVTESTHIEYICLDVILSPHFPLILGQHHRPWQTCQMGPL